MIRNLGQEGAASAVQIPYRKFPGIPATADGAGAAVWSEGQVVHAASSFPVQPIQAMHEAFADYCATGVRNAWNETIELIPADSPLEAASICQGFAVAGGRAVSFVSGQSLPAMTEAMVSIAGQRLPLVFHLGARALQSQGTPVLAGHDDVMSLAGLGWGIVFARDPQEVADLALICRRAAEYAETPFLVVQDAYATTHRIRDVYLPEPALVRLFLGETETKVKNHFNSRRPVMINPVQSGEDYMQGRMAQRAFLDRAEAALQASMREFTRLTGREYASVSCYRMDDAEHVLMGCGSMMDACEQAVDSLRKAGVKAGSITLRSFRPFPDASLTSLLVGRRSVVVFERTDTPLSPANPLTLSVQHLLQLLQVPDGEAPRVTSAVVGLGSLQVDPQDFLRGALKAMAEWHAAARLTHRGVAHGGVGVPPEPPSFVAVEPPRAATGLLSLRTGGSRGIDTIRLAAGVTRAIFGVHVDAEGFVGVERVGEPQALRLAASPDARPDATQTQAKLAVVQQAGLLFAAEPLRHLADGGVLFCPFVHSAESLWKMLPTAIRREVRRRGIRLAGLRKDVAAALRQGLPSMVSSEDILTLGAWLRISPFLREQQLTETFVQEAMENHFLSVWPGIAKTDVERIYDLARQVYLGMVRMAAPEPEEDQIPGVSWTSLEALAVLPASAQVPNEPDFSYCPPILGAGVCEQRLDLDLAEQRARGQAPPATGISRSCRHDAEDLPVIDMERCVGCMDCVAVCPDVAILGRVTESGVLAARLAAVDDATERALLSTRFGRTRRYYDAAQERGETPGMLGLFVDPDRCKGCGECVDACAANHAIVMASKSNLDMAHYDEALAFADDLPFTPEHFLQERSLGDLLLSERAKLSTGGAGNCSGCGQSTVVRLLLSSTGFQYGADNIGVIAAAGCDSVFGSVYPHNPYRVAWTNTLASNAPAEALGIRRRWNREGGHNRKLWVLGGMDSFGGAGLSSLAALLSSGEDVNILVLDSKIYQTQSRQLRTAAYVSVNRGSGLHEQEDLRASTALSQIGMLYPDVYVAQTTASHLGHFQKCIQRANEYAGPSLVVCYATCIADDGVESDHAHAQARLAVESRAFPLLTYDPEKGADIRSRLSLSGNPAPRADWYVLKDGAVQNLIGFAASEARFAPYFGTTGEALPSLEQANAHCLAEWQRLQGLAGLR